MWSPCAVLITGTWRRSCDCSALALLVVFRLRLFVLLCFCVKEPAMPTYEYACPTCGIVEAFQSIKEPALTKCPSCKKAKVQRMVSSGAGVIFKGSGFWETDYNRGGDYAKKQKADVAPVAGKSAGKGDTKPTDKPITPSPA